MSEKKRYVVVGTGGRAVMFVDAILDTYKESSELLGICDISQVRMDWHNRRIERARGCPAVATYTADRFDEMIADTKPNVVIVCTMDCFHHEYIVRAMDLGCDAISEKPMTTDAPKARAILEAIERTGRNLRVTFNYRYKAEASAMKQQIMAGAIGRPLSVDFSWMLHTSHGADYFRRWHREKDKSGGLLVHKATHHFDLVNWLIESHPKSVYCMGDLAFYGRKNAEKRGESVTYTRYTGEADAATDPFALHLDDNPHKLEDPDMKGLYLDAEDETGYLRDRNVFGDDITIEDTMAVVARYDSGVVLSYCLVAYAPWEGLRLTITGDRGRIELFEREGNHIIGQNDEEIAAAQDVGYHSELTLFPMFGVPRKVEIPKLKGGHGGADPLLLEDIFSTNPPADPLNRAASHIDGAASILLGISANESIRTGKPVTCADLIPLPKE